MTRHPLPELPPVWMPETTARAIEEAARRARARGRDGAAEAWEAAWKYHPALPATAINEAVAVVLRRAGL